MLGSGVRSTCRPYGWHGSAWPPQSPGTWGSPSQSWLSLRIADYLRALLAWAFLLDMLGSAIKVNHWVMDTSLLYHLALAPAVNPNWRIAGIYLAIGFAAAVAGGWRFTQRDLQSS